MVVVDSKGRIVLPKRMREQLGITPGTEVALREEDGKLVVEVEDDPDEIIERLERIAEEAAADRDPPDEDMHPIAENHAETIRRQAKDADE